jgi:hypothetical protein
MKRICTTILAALTMATLALGAGIDGTWTYESKAKGRKGGPERTVKSSLTLKAEGSALTGKAEHQSGKRPKLAEIKNGKIDGNKVTFDTSTFTKKKGEVVQHWTGTLDGDQLTVTISGKGKGKAGAPITLKRQV